MPASAPHSDSVGLDGFDIDGFDVDSFDVDGFRAAVLAWYDAEGRTFPFRGTTDPYLVLVSETILQQTQVSRGAPAWESFVARFPTVEALAAATAADVLRAWAGLGYNRRALNLHRAARIVVEELGGRFPRDVAGLRRLPGVGPYTARAVASIAHGISVGAVDTNVRRVLGRAFAGDPAAIKARDLQAVADAIAPADRPADWTHALMDVGSTRCRPRSPSCGTCPARPFCRYAAGVGPKGPKGEGFRAHGPGTPGHPLEPMRAAARERPAPYRATSRWLRGEIVRRLRAADGEAWTTFDGSIGEHDPAAVAVALDALAVDGLAEVDAPGDGSPRARLPVQ